MTQNPFFDQDAKDKAENQVAQTIEVVAYPAAAVVGSYFTRASVSDHLYDNLKHVDKLDALEKLRVDHVKAHGRELTGNTATELAEFHKEFSKTYNKALEGAGFDGFFKRFTKGLHKNQRLEAVAHGVTAAGLTLGVLLTVSNSTFLDRFKREAEKKDEAQKSL